MALFRMQLIPPGTAFDFVKGRWIGFGVSILLTLATAALVYDRGLNLGIDFAGGILMEIRTEKPADIHGLREVLETPEMGEVSLQGFEDPRDVMIRIETPKEDEQAALVEKAKKLIVAKDATVDFRKIDYVGPTVGKELIESGVMALVIALGGMMCYIWFRFEWQFGLGGVIALLHDIVMMVGFFAVTGLDFGLTSIAAILTVVGYSINDSVVIYDRIRENMRKYKKMHFHDLLNLSMNETLSRTIVTAMTTAIAALMLAIFGGAVIEGFCYALFFGIVVGTYSSIYISAPLLIYFGIRRDSLLTEAEAEAA